MKQTIVKVLLALLPLTASAQMPPSGFGGVQQQIELQTSQVWRDVNYADDGQAYHTCDIYLPKVEKKSYPVVVHVYGSAWFSNSGKGAADLGTIVNALLNEGYAVVCPNHRSSGDAKWPAQLHDMKAVVRFIRGEAKTYKFDTSFIATSGFSSGAHLAAITATTSGTKRATIAGEEWDLEGTLGKYTKESSKVNACCEWSGPVDPFTIHLVEHMKMGDMSPEEILLNQKFGVNDERFNAMSALYFLDAKDPAIMVCHGDNDKVVPFDQGKRFAEALEKSGVKTEHIYVPGGGHGFNMYSAENLKRMTNFFNSIKK